MQADETLIYEFSKEYRERHRVSDATFSAAVKMFGEQLKDTKAQPASGTWSELSSAINDVLEKMTTGGMAPQAAADEMQKQAESIGTK